MLSGPSVEADCDLTEVCDASGTKRRRTDPEAVNNNVAGWRANDMIALLFYNAVIGAGSGDRTDHYEVSPEYTHQLFDDERVILTVPEGRHIREVRIRVFIDCRDLSHSIIFPPRSLLAHEEARQLLQRMRSGLPPDCAVIEDDLLLSSDSSWRGGEVLKRVRRTKPSAMEEPFRLLSSCCDPWTVCRPSYRAPPGQLVDSFRKGDLQLAVHLASNAHEGAGLLLQRAEKLAMWFIETADSVDFSDDRWEVLFLFAGDIATSPSAAQKVDRFVGYFTLFSFRNPYLGTKLRVCQALIAPFAQHRGLGRELLLCVYRLAAARPGVSEVTVEDPCPAFQALRDRVDFDWYLQHYGMDQKAQGRREASVVRSELDDCGSGIDNEAYVDAVGQRLKIVREQVQFVLECVEYMGLLREGLGVSQLSSSVHSPINGSRGSSESSTARVRSVVVSGLLEGRPDFKAFRLEVKRRILRRSEFNLIPPSDIPSLKAERQRALNCAFAEQLRRYQALHGAAIAAGLL